MGLCMVDHTFILLYENVILFKVSYFKAYEVSIHLLPMLVLSSFPRLNSKAYPLL